MTVQKWEYIDLHILVYHKSGVGRMIAWRRSDGVNGETEEDSSGFLHLLNGLGEGGWELIAAISTGEKASQLFFKRPKI